MDARYVQVAAWSTTWMFLLASYDFVESDLKDVVLRPIAHLEIEVGEM